MERGTGELKAAESIALNESLQRNRDQFEAFKQNRIGAYQQAIQHRGDQFNNFKNNGMGLRKFAV